MYEEINRFTSAEKVWNGLFNTFGTDEWKRVNLETDPQKREYLLIEIYKNQLINKAKAKYVRTFKMINKSNRTDYYLFFATNNYDGLKKMKEAMWKVDEQGFFEFSDATYNPAQATLFELKPDFSKLKRLIINEFKGKTVSVENLERFVVIQTPFLGSHFKRQILKPMEESNPSEVIIESIGKRRRGTFPEGTQIKFI
jgi:hypothetical protein